MVHLVFLNMISPQCKKQGVRTPDKPIPSGLVEVTVMEVSKKARVRSLEHCYMVIACLVFDSISGVGEV